MADSNFMKYLLFSLLCVLSYEKVCGYRILGVFPHVGKSHSYAFVPLMKGLAEKGHEVTMISHFPIEDAPRTYKDISLRGSLKIWLSSFTFGEFDYPWGTERFMKHMYSAKNLFLIGDYSCRAMLENDQVKNIKKGDFDLVIIEQFNSDCGLAIVHKLGVPFIGVTSHVMMSWTYGRLGLIDNPSYVASHYLEYGPKPNVFQTAESLLLGNWYKLVYYLFCQIPERRLLSQYGYDLPPLEDVAKNMSLILINTYFPLTGAVPLPPNAVEIGGIHMQEKKKIRPDLQEYLDGATDGVILFSMGSMLRATSWPPAKLEAFKAALGALPHRVLWKWENDTMEGVPNNVKLTKWIPQFDVLHHKNVKAFITHAGMLGLSEAVHCGVPVVAIPIYGDQFSNAAAAREMGTGVYLHYKDISEQTVTEALKQALDPQMQANAKKLSELWKDRPSTPLETAIYWVEHVARHGGSHLRPPSADLPLYRYLLLDVFAILALVSLLPVLVLYWCCTKCRRKQETKTENVKSKKNK